MAVDTDISQCYEYLLGSLSRACVQTRLLSLKVRPVLTCAHKLRVREGRGISLLAWGADYPSLADSEVDSQQLSGAVRPGENPVRGREG